ncbi:MAG: hypothetical protein AAF127_03455 [Pseudomonadota bacterium]
MRLIWKLSGGRWGVALGALLLLLASPLLAPQLLAFPHKGQTELGPVWSEDELDPAMLERAVETARQRLDTSPLAQADERRDIFVTNGGWRWTYLANTVSDAFALTRPVNDAIIINRTDPSSGIVRNGDKIAGERTLADLLAHEFTHGMINRRYGRLRARFFPTWKIEGYCDHIAGASSLSAQDAARLEREGRSHPALAYYHARRRVAAILAANGGSPDALFLED